MELQFFGANCIKLGNKKVTMVIDDNLESLGAKSVTTENDISLFTIDKPEQTKGRFLVCGPGEYEISEVSIMGIPAKAHLDAVGHRATIYSIRFDNFSIGIVGHIHPDINEDQLEALGLIDILVIPVGGNGFTLDASGAASLIRKIEPKIVIPTHYSNKKLNYEVPQADLELFLKEMAVTEPEILPILKIKESDLGDKTRVVVLES